MDVAALQALIKDSHILTEDERTYWAASVPKMTPEQLSKLENILQRAAKIPWTEHIQSYFKLIAKSAKQYFGAAA